MYLTPSVLENSRWPVAWAIGIPVLLIFIDLTPMGSNLLWLLMGLPALMGAWVIAALVAAVKAISAVVRRQWQRAAFTAVLPATVVCVALNFWMFLGFCMTSADLTHWLVMRPVYMEVLRRTPTKGVPRVFLSTFTGVWSVARGYVYDDTDQILLSPELRTAAWTASAQQSPLDCSFGVKPFPGHLSFTRHWYLMSSEC